MSEDVEETFEEVVEVSQDNVGHTEGVTSIEQSNGTVINQEDNVMMKNLLSLTKKSQNNNLDQPSDAVMGMAEDQEDSDVVVEEEEEVSSCHRSLHMDFSNCKLEELDVNKFNYDVILGFVSKGELIECKVLLLSHCKANGKKFREMQFYKDLRYTLNNYCPICSKNYVLKSALLYKIFCLLIFVFLYSCYNILLFQLGSW